MHITRWKKQDRKWLHTVWLQLYDILEGKTVELKETWQFAEGSVGEGREEITTGNIWATETILHNTIIVATSNIFVKTCKILEHEKWGLMHSN